jgi:hypothetical protein
MPVRPPALGRPRRTAARTAPHAQRIVAILLGVLVVGVLVGLFSGWWAGGQAAAPPPAASPDAPRSAAAGPVRFEVTSDWVPVPRVPGVDGLPKATAAFTPAASLRAYAFVTVAPTDDPSLLPQPIRALMPATLPRPKKTELLGLPAWRYGELSISGDRMLEVTVIPSTAGTMAVACIAPRESWVAALGCAADVRKLELPGDATWLPPAADVAARAAIPGIVRPLDAKRVKLRTRLDAAKTRGAQSRIAGKLSTAYNAAALQLEDVSPGKGPAAAVLGRLKANAVNYGKLGNAAAAGAPRRYKRAKRAVKKSEAQLKAALAELG